MCTCILVLVVALCENRLIRVEGGMACPSQPGIAVTSRVIGMKATIASRQGLMQGNRLQPLNSAALLLI